MMFVVFSLQVSSAVWICWNGADSDPFPPAGALLSTNQVVVFVCGSGSASAANTTIGVSWTVGVAVCSGVGSAVGVTVCSGVGVAVGVAVCSGVGVAVGVAVCSGVGVAVGVTVCSGEAGVSAITG